MNGSTSRVLYECWGRDMDAWYHCWIMERCIPLDRFAEYEHANKEKCVLAACRCIAKNAMCGLLISDCHFFNFGIRITDSDTEHEVVIIDAGSRGLADMAPKKKS